MNENKNSIIFIIYLLFLISYIYFAPLLSSFVFLLICPFEGLLGCLDSYSCFRSLLLACYHCLVGWVLSFRTLVYFDFDLFVPYFLDFVLSFRILVCSRFDLFAHGLCFVGFVPSFGILVCSRFDLFVPYFVGFVLFFRILVYSHFDLFVYDSYFVGFILSFRILVYFYFYHFV